MIIFGTRTRPEVMGGFKNKCPECRNKTTHSVAKITSWFTLYFIPLIPYSNKLFVTCHACGVRHELTGEAKENMEALVGNKPQEIGD